VYSQVIEKKEEAALLSQPLPRRKEGEGITNHLIMREGKVIKQDGKEEGKQQ